MPTKQNNQDYPSNEPGDERSHQDEDENASLTSSQADAKALEEAAGVDLRAIPTEHSGEIVLMFWNAFSFISFIFMLVASCPVPWMRDGDGRTWTLWKNVDGTQWKDYPCDHKRQMFQAMQAFSIVGCILSLGSLIAGILQSRGRGHLGVTLLFGILTAMVELTDWAMMANQYHKYNCAGQIAYVDHISRLNAGFALVVVSFGLMMMGLTALVYWMTSYLRLSEKHRSKFHLRALYSALINIGIVTIATVGTAQEMWEHYDTQISLKITYWHVEFYHRNVSLSETWSLDTYHCPAFTSRMHVGAAFSIISDCFLLFMLLCSVAAVYNRAFKWATIGFGAASWVFLLICWAISVSIRYTKFCPSSPSTTTATAAIYGAPLDNGEQQVDFTGFVITNGLGMIISAWCFLTANLIYLAIKG